MHGFHLGVDYGSSHTVALLRWPDGRVRPLLFDGSPLLPSAVYGGHDGRILVGADAVRAARFEPSRFEPNPKRRVDEGELLLGDRTFPLVDLVAATLRQVLAEAVRTAGTRPGQVTVTYPAGWGPARQALLTDAATGAGLGPVRLVPEPVAAATYLAASTAAGGAARDIVVYDLGGGTCDVSVVRSDGKDVRVLASGGADVGGIDLDWLVLDQIAAAMRFGSAAQWTRLVAPVSAEDRRMAMLMREDARSAKETLSRQSSAGVHVPIVNRDVHVSRETFELAAAATLAPTATLTLDVIRRAGTRPDQIAGLYLVGGSTRVPVVATILHRTTGIAPTVLEHPEIVVAEGALAVLEPTTDPPVSTVDQLPPAPAQEPARDDRADPERHEADPSVLSSPLTRLGLVGAVLLVAALVVVAVATGSGDPGDNQDAGPAPSSSTPPSPDRRPLYTTPLPDACSIGVALPARVAGVPGQPTGGYPDSHGCHWQQLAARDTVDLTIGMRLFLNTTSPTDDARQAFAWARSSDASEIAFHDTPQPVPGVGDEAYVTACRARIEAGPGSLADYIYEVAGACLTVRSRNLLLEIELRGGGPALDFAAALEQDLALARELLPRLTTG